MYIKKNPTNSSCTNNVWGAHCETVNIQKKYHTLMWRNNCLLVTQLSVGVLCYWRCNTKLSNSVMYNSYMWQGVINTCLLSTTVVESRERSHDKSTPTWGHWLTSTVKWESMAALHSSLFICSTGATTRLKLCCATLPTTWQLTCVFGLSFLSVL